jgi:hypothetical protein
MEIAATRVGRAMATCAADRIRLRQAGLVRMVVASTDRARTGIVRRVAGSAAPVRKTAGPMAHGRTTASLMVAVRMATVAHTLAHPMAAPMIAVRCRREEIAVSMIVWAEVVRHSRRQEIVATSVRKRDNDLSNIATAISG